MIVVKVARSGQRCARPPLYTPEDWRIDVIQTGTCQVCREPALFHDLYTAECRRCGFWFDGFLAGRLGGEELL